MFVLRWLRNTDQPVLSYVWRAWLLDRIPTLALATILGALFKVEDTTSSLPDSFSWWFLFGTGLVAPWAETLLMWPILSILKRVMGNQNILAIALASAAIWGILHERIQPLWGLTVFWGFFILSLSFLEWEKKSKRKAIVVTGLLHTCMNAVPHSILLLLGLLLDSPPDL